ncbi:hypothetical protein D3C81_1754140 [compost metagenome]
MDSAWSETNHWSPPNWTTIVYNTVPTLAPSAEFSVLLPGFIIGQSEWSATIDAKLEDDRTSDLTMQTTCYPTNAGLILNFKQSAQNKKSISLSVDYHPNQGLLPTSKSHAKFTLGK